MKRITMTAKNILRVALTLSCLVFPACAWSAEKAPSGVGGRAAGVDLPPEFRQLLPLHAKLGKPQPGSTSTRNRGKTTASTSSAGRSGQLDSGA